MSEPAAVVVVEHIDTTTPIVEPNSPAAPAPQVTEEEWPPRDWKDTFVEPQTHLLRITNIVPHVIADLEHTTEEAQRYADGRRIPMIFFAHDKKKTKFANNQWDPADWQLMALPSLPGLGKAVYVQKATVKFLNELRDICHNIGLKWWPVPHPVSRGLFVIKALYVFAGNTINDEFAGCISCMVCGKRSGRTCPKCDAVVLCSQFCEDIALQFNTHGSIACQIEVRKRLRLDSVTARDRIIQSERVIERDREAMRQRQQAQQSQSSAKNKHQLKKRAKLRLESARARKAIGLPPDPRLPTLDDDGNPVASSSSSTTTK